MIGPTVKSCFGVKIFACLSNCGFIGCPSDNMKISVCRLSTFGSRQTHTLLSSDSPKSTQKWSFLNVRSNFQPDDIFMITAGKLPPNLHKCTYSTVSINWISFKLIFRWRSLHKSRRVYSLFTCRFFRINQNDWLFGSHRNPTWPFRLSKIGTWRGSNMEAKLSRTKLKPPGYTSPKNGLYRGLGATL